MDIGKEERTIHVEPLETPVPRERPVERPRERPVAPPLPLPETAPVPSRGGVS